MLGSTALQRRSGAPPAQQPQPRRRQWRRRRQACKAEAGGGAPGLPSREEVLARISKAREYKTSKVQERQAAPEAATPEAAASAPATPASSNSSEAVGDVEQAFSDAAQALAAKEEADFLQAVSEAKASAQSSRSSSSGEGQLQARAGPAIPSSPAGQAAASASKDAVLARINAAKKYKGGSSGSSRTDSGSSGSKPALHSPPPAPAPAQAQVQQQQQQQLAAQAEQLQQQQAQQQQQQDAEQARSFRTGAGGADRAANWLVFSENSADGGEAAAQIDASLSAEQFTLAKEELKKKQEVEIITVDAGYAASVRRERREQQGVAAPAEEEQAAGEGASEEQGQGESLHKPKVATWGVFPRPKNISEAYGGGRNLRPGQALESDEAAAERQQRVAAALKEYRKTLGLDIDPAVEQQAQALYVEGAALFEQGLIIYALPKFAEASELMALRSRLGGEARLQQAICLDSLGRNQEAYDIYKRIENHPAPGVAKKAKRMLFGWKAADQLKVGNLSYTPSTSQWKRYFDAINKNSVYSGTYVSSDEEGPAAGGGDSRFAAAAAVAVAALPLAFVAYRVVTH